MWNENFSVPLPALLGAGVILLVMALAVLVSRAARRASRDSARNRAAELFRMLAARLAGHLDTTDLQAATGGVESDTFWDAVEAIATTLRRRERVELARALARSTHLREERKRLFDEAPLRRELAARRLGLLPARRSRKPLRRALVRGPELVSFASARALAQHHDLGALRWILRNPTVLARRPLPSLSGLVRSFGPGARATLIAALEQGIAETRLECAVIDALGVTRCRSAREAIERRVGDPRPELRVTAVRALGRLDMGESIPSLLAALDDEAWPVRAQAARALGRLRATPAVEALTDRVCDLSWWVRRHAAYALARIGDEGVDALCDLAARSPDPYAREMAREALDHGVARKRPA